MHLMAVSISFIELSKGLDPPLQTTEINKTQTIYLKANVCRL